MSARKRKCNTYHRTIKIEHINVKDNTYVNFGKKVNNNDAKFKIGDHVRISKYKNISAKRYASNWSEEVLKIIKVKNTIPLTYVINNLNGGEVIGTVSEKGMQNTNQKEYRILKLIKKKRNKL